VGLKEISERKKLAILCLYKTKVTNAGLKELRCLKNLAILTLDDTKVTDAGLKELKDMKGLTALRLGGTQVSDAGLKELGNLKNLAYLDLLDTKVTDAGMKGLKQLKNLIELDLHYTQVTDVGLKELKDLENLTRLDLIGTNVTAEGAKQLRSAMPGCKIRHLIVPNTPIGLAVFVITGDGGSISVDNSEVVVKSSTIDLVVRKGIDCVPTLLTIMKDDGISFDLFVHCYSCCDQILRAIDSKFIIAWQGGAQVMDNEYGQATRFLPSHPLQDEKEYRTRVVNDIEKKYALTLKQKGKR
jgi:hypothetical protein